MHQVIIPLPGDGEPDGSDAVLNMRWTASRKAELLARLRARIITLPDALRRYRLTLEEVDQWQQAHRRAGQPGLKATAQPQQGRLL